MSSEISKIGVLRSGEGSSLMNLAFTSFVGLVDFLKSNNCFAHASTNLATANY